MSAISLARRSISSGPGTPMPLPCTEIFPLIGFFSFIHLQLRKPNPVYVLKVTARIATGKVDFPDSPIDDNRGSMEKDFKTLRLKNGGHLAFAEYGVATGEPVFFFHGWPSSRTMAELTDAAARELNVRIISADRPGICDSSFSAERKLTDWPGVMEQFADHLGIDAFRILAISGGAPYAYVTGWKLPDRVRAVAVVSGAVPFTDLNDHSGLLPLYRWMIWFYGNQPRLLRALFGLARPIISWRAS